MANAPPAVVQFECVRAAGGGPIDLNGNAGRNILTGPGHQNVGLAATRTLSATEDLRPQFRAEAFNLRNRANDDVPVFLLRASHVGPMTATQGDARQLQRALRVLF